MPYRIQLTVASLTSGLSAEKTVEIFVRLSGDINGHGEVNIHAKVAVRNAFGQIGPPGWIPTDVNSDGSIYILDKVTVRNQFGQNGCACHESYSA